MLQKIGKLLGGDPHKREIEHLSGIADEVNQLEESFEKLSDTELRAKTEEFRRRLNDGKTLDDILPEAFATVRAASKRTIGLRQYDVQVIGGIAIHQGKIVEMRTGEGKTLVATMPIYLNALAGKGVHLITVNDYLARRDARWMAPIYDFLGLSVSVLQMASKTENGQKAFLVDLNKESSIEDQHQLKMVHRREAYAADITYGTNNEFGFDYLRDNLTMRLEHRVQRGHNFAIIDEVDNVLIDEARTPLIISGPASSETELYERMAQIVRQLQPEDYEINERDRNVVLTEAGEAHVEELLETPLRDPDRPEDITPEQARLLGHLEQAMRAQYLYRRNKEYLVQGGKVVIVDEFTGRLMPGRRWSEGLHQAVEAKEGVKIEPENVTYATITLQNYFRMYEKLAGMTGTALTEAEEFDKIYSLEVLQLPTNLEFTAAKEGSGLDEIQGKDESGYRYTCYVRSDDPEKHPLYWKRKDYPDVVYRTEEGKFRAIVQEIMRYHILGRPILLGTTSVENSERLSIRLNTDFVRRLAQVLIIRQAYIEQNNIDFIERAIPELELLNKPIDQLQSAELRNLTRSLNISLNPEDAENMRMLQKILDLQDEDQPRLTKTLQGGIQHQVLNARKHDEESQIIAKAGSFGAVTIATNMAGRGVDIKLGGELPEETQADVVRVMAKNGFEGLYNMKNEKRRDVLKNMDAEQFGIYEDSINSFLQIMEDNERVRKLGGLHVIGSERHEARRIDNQLRGRAARQGDPGSSRFYLSLEDELMRIFGGQQAEGLFKRLNVDENLPIEHNILGRLVEQSQERVEGSHFDVRKHLLEYDDVLNTQRERIYSQRDRVFTKEDLSEDVLDMLTVELQDRIPQSLKNDEGPWKLLAFLEEIQPPIHYDSNHYPSYTQHLLLSEIKHSMTGSGQPKEDLQHALLELSRNALEEERNHLTIATRSLIERTEESFLTQLEERLDLADTFFSSMDDVDEDNPNMQAPKPQDIYAQLSETVRIPLKLSQNQIRSLADQDDEVIEEIKKQIEDYLTNIIINRLSMSIERRLQENLDTKPSQLQGMGWGDASRALFEAMENSLEQKIERLLADQGPLMRDINTEVQKINDGEIADHQITEMLSILSRGTRTTFDRRTHRQKKVLYTRLSYTYLCAKLMEGQPSEEATEDILDHLEGAIESLKMAWGEMEWNRLLQNEIKLNQLDERIKNQFIDAYGEDFTQLGETSLMEFSEEERQIACDIIGKRLQNEVYRQLLLSVISEQWVEYLTRVEALRISIGMEAYAQRDPLVMYKSQATDMFKNLLADIRMAVVSRMFTYRPKRASEVKVEQQETPDTAQAGSEPAQQQEQKEEGDQTTKKSSKSRRRRRR